PETHVRPLHDALPISALGRELAVAEEAQRAGDAAHLQALGLQRLVALADDELGAAAADVDDEPALRRGCQVVRDAEVDQAGLLRSEEHTSELQSRENL